MGHKNNLLVEGKNDKHVILSLMQHFDVNPTFDIKDCGSVEKAIENFRLYLSKEAARIEIIAIVLDADQDFKCRWEGVKSVISATKAYSLPNSLPSGGLVLTPICEDYPKLGVWIMPNNFESGMLEDFAVMLAEKDDELMKEAETELRNLEQRGINKYKSIHRTKAKIHSYLAWQDEPGKPMGQAITAKLLNPEASMAKKFVNWVNDVFNKELI